MLGIKCWEYSYILCNDSYTHSVLHHSFTILKIHQCKQVNFKLQDAEIITDFNIVLTLEIYMFEGSLKNGDISFVGDSRDGSLVSGSLTALYLL